MRAQRTWRAPMDGFCNSERTDTHLGRGFQQRGITQLFQGAIKCFQSGPGHATYLYYVLVHRARHHHHRHHQSARGDGRARAGRPTARRAQTRLRAHAALGETCASNGLTWALFALVNVNISPEVFRQRSPRIRV